MEYRVLSNGVKMPQLGYGVYQGQSIWILFSSISRLVMRMEHGEHLKVCMKKEKSELSVFLISMWTEWWSL